MEATDATHETQFYQIRRLDGGQEKTNLANLKGRYKNIFAEIFGDENIDIRFRASYFPFVEPGVEGGYEVQGQVAGRLPEPGMVHPKIFDNMKINPNEWQGFAFGMSVERLAMIKYKIDDIRLFYSGDSEIYQAILKSKKTKAQKKSNFGKSS